MSDECKRRVVCAANRFSDGTIILGARHWDELMREHAMQIGRMQCGAEQGFIDQWRVFMTRKEAWSVAVEANQIIRDVGCSGELYSENLY